MGERVHIDPCLAPAIFSWDPIMIGCADSHAIDGFGRSQKAAISDNISDSRNDCFRARFWVGILECNPVRECGNGKFVCDSSLR